VSDLVTGYQNPIVLDINTKMDSQYYRDYYWKTGDAIIYNANVSPFLKSNAQKQTFTVSSGALSTEFIGRIKLMNDLPFSNVATQVLSGFGSNDKVWMPFPSSDIRFD
jgi:hypothetical protein